MFCKGGKLANIQLLLCFVSVGARLSLCVREISVECFDKVYLLFIIFRTLCITWRLRLADLDQTFAVRFYYAIEGVIFQLILRFFLFAGLEGGAIIHFYFGFELRKVFLRTNYSLSSQRSSQLQLSLISFLKSFNSSLLSNQKLSRLNINP